MCFKVYFSLQHRCEVVGRCCRRWQWATRHSRYTQGCQIGHFVAKLISQCGHLRPLVATVRCGRRPQNFWDHTKVIHGHSSLWPNATTFDRSQWPEILATMHLFTATSWKIWPDCPSHITIKMLWYLATMNYGGLWSQYLTGYRETICGWRVSQFSVAG